MTFDHRTLQSMLSYSKELNGDLETWIDELTLCLKHRLSGEIYETDAESFTHVDLQQTRKWNFKWRQYFSYPDYELYKLVIRGQNRIEGLICLEPDEGFVFVHLVESAPWNIGSENQEFVGVGAHLFAVACRRSFELGYEDFICFVPKTGLITHYQQELDAILIGNGRMALGTEQAKRLINIYF